MRLYLLAITALDKYNCVMCLARSNLGAGEKFLTLLLSNWQLIKYSLLVGT